MAVIVPTMATRQKNHAIWLKDSFVGAACVSRQFDSVWSLSFKMESYFKFIL